MPVPMIGSLSIEVRGVRPYTIHGDLYFEVHAADPDDPAKLVAFRVPQHAIDGEPRAGERLTLTFLMGQVTGAKRG